MEYQTLGRTGLVVSRLGLGSWVTYSYQLGAPAAFELMELAFKAGVNLFDNAEAYAKGEAERIMGEALRMGIEKGVWTRSQLVVTTKLFFGTGEGGHNSKVSVGVERGGTMRCAARRGAERTRARPACARSDARIDAPALARPQRADSVLDGAEREEKGPEVFDSVQG